MPIVSQNAPQNGTICALPTPPSPEKSARPREEVLPHAERLCALLAPFCAQIEIAGSLRRGKPLVGDIEIVALPFPQTREAQSSLDFDFTGPAGKPARPAEYVFCPALSEQLTRLRAWKTISLDPSNPRDGRLYKRFTLPELDGFGVDLFLATPENFGNTLTIRTGSAAFSAFLMGRAKRRLRRQWNGYLWQCRPGDIMKGDVPVPKGRERIACRTEQDYFRAVGVPWLPPHERSEAGIALLKREAMRA